jgi:integration host factor subunit beta
VTGEVDRTLGGHVAKNKADLIDLLSTRRRLSHAQAESIVNEVLDSLTEALVRGEGIELRGFGSFTIRSYGAYQGRNPRTGETVDVKPKRQAFFKVGKQLRDRVHAGRFAAQERNRAPKLTPDN